MTYINNQILQNNAIEAWAMAIRYCDYILEGKATLEYRKHFVSVLHNSAELFIKQLMLNNTDYRVTQLKKDAAQMDSRQLFDFTYRNAVKNTVFVQNLKEQLEGEIFPANDDSTFNIFDSIACVLNEYHFIEMLNHYVWKWAK